MGNNGSDDDYDDEEE
jgi:hypothetical protein